MAVIDSFPESRQSAQLQTVLSIVLLAACRFRRIDEARPLHRVRLVRTSSWTVCHCLPDSFVRRGQSYDAADLDRVVPEPPEACLCVTV